MKPEKTRVKIDTVESGNWRVNTIHCQYTFQLQLHNQFVWFIMSSFHSSHSHHHLHPVHSQALQLNCAFSVLYLTNIHTPGIQTHNTYILYLTLPSVPSLLKYCGDEWSVSLSLCLCQRESRSRKTRRARLWTADEEPSNRPRSTSSRTMSSLPRSSDSRRSALCAGILSGQWLCLQHRINKIYRQHEWNHTSSFFWQRAYFMNLKKRRKKMSLSDCENVCLSWKEHPLTRKEPWFTNHPLECQPCVHYQFAWSKSDLCPSFSPLQGPQQAGL